MNSHNVRFCGEIRKNINTFLGKASYRGLCCILFETLERNLNPLKVMLGKVSDQEQLCWPQWLSWMRVRQVIRSLWVRPLPGPQHSFMEIDH